MSASAFSAFLANGRSQFTPLTARGTDESVRFFASRPSTESWIRKLRLAGFGGGADPGGKSPKRDAFPIAVIAHEKVIRPLRAQSTRSLNRKAAVRDLSRLNGRKVADCCPIEPIRPTAAKADYVDASIMLSHVRRRAPTARLERKAPISHST
jgi:hypothetical protein